MLNNNNNFLLKKMIKISIGKMGNLYRKNGEISIGKNGKISIGKMRKFL